jgi:hypothetical protein
MRQQDKLRKQFSPKSEQYILKRLYILVEKNFSMHLGMPVFGSWFGQVF